MFRCSVPPVSMAGSTSAHSTSTTALSSPLSPRTSRRRCSGSASLSVKSRSTRHVHWHLLAAWVSMPSSSSSPLSGSSMVRTTTMASPM